MVSEAPRTNHNVTPPPRVIAHPKARWLLRLAVLVSVGSIGFILAYCQHLADLLSPSSIP